MKFYLNSIGVSPVVTPLITPTIGGFEWIATVAEVQKTTR
jgi:hypothetical protein